MESFISQKIYHTSRVFFDLTVPLYSYMRYLTTAVMYCEPFDNSLQLPSSTCFYLSFQTLAISILLLLSTDIHTCSPRFDEFFFVDVVFQSIRTDLTSKFCQPQNDHWFYAFAIGLITSIVRNFLVEEPFLCAIPVN